LGLTGFLLLGLAVQAGPPAADSVPDYIKEYRQARDQRIRNQLSLLALVHREYLPESGRVTIGRNPDATIHLEGESVAPLHAVIEMDGATPTLKAVGPATLSTLDDPPRPIRQLALKEYVPFRAGAYNLLYKFHGSWGHIIEVYDLSRSRYREFSGMEFFPFDAAYKLTGTVVPAESPEQIELIDSHGNKRPYWIYGRLEFKLEEQELALELYTVTIDRKEIEEGEFMLIFADATSGKETYPAARYLYVEGKAAGPITVDFNKAYSPPCSFSPVWTCPFPRTQNRLPVAVRAGEKWYRTEHYGK
jgi:uncharacterized protein (DUF1684 family)